MNIFDRFSTHLKDILTRSIILANETNHEEVYPLHILFVLSVVKGSIAFEVISRYNLDDKIFQKMLQKIPTSKPNITSNKKSKTKEKQLANYSMMSRLALEKTVMLAYKQKHNYIGTEHLLATLVELNDPLIDELLTAHNIRKEDLLEQIQTILNNDSQFPKIAEAVEAIENKDDNINTGSLLGPPMNNPLSSMFAEKRPETTPDNALAVFATNLINKEIQQGIDPVIGRDYEIERMIHILSRRTKNNPILIGDPGVGKTAIVEGLSKKIYDGQVPDTMLNKKIYVLDMAMLIAGTSFRGEFEARLQHVIADITQDPNIIVFIDELHNIIGAGSSNGNMDAANILKPALSRGQLHCIGATTPGEFKKYIENDSALERRFQPIHVKQSSVDDTKKILLGIKDNYERYHSVNITQASCKAAARLSDRYITNKQLPDKAIDLLDETAASVRLAGKTPAHVTELMKLERQLEIEITAKEKAAQQDNYEQALKHKEKEQKIQKKIMQLQKKNIPNKIYGTVKEKDVIKQLSRIINTSVDELLLENRESLLNIEKELSKKIIGQDHIIKQVAYSIRQSQLQLSEPNRPLASLVFVGHSGVGKTELAKTIADVIYPKQDALIKLDMSEYNESFGVSKLLGSPAGYIGYKESNNFTDKLKLNPYSVVLFDEFDKAHPNVRKLLLQILENGEITDATGRKISLKHAIIIVTTTHGAEEASRQNFGFNNDDSKTSVKLKILREKLKEFFTPELINRLDHICLFNELTNKDLEKIAQLEINNLNERLKKYQTNVKATTDVMQKIIKNIPNEKINARDIRSQVRKELESLISQQILEQKIKPVYKLKYHKKITIE